jgi:ankyrin repeat protein
MADTVTDTGVTEDSEKGGLGKRKKLLAAATTLGVLSILLGVALWMFLSPTPKVSDRWLGAELLSELDTGLLQAVRDNDVAAVFLLLDAGANVNARDPTGVTPIKAAIALNRLNIVRQFLAARGGTPPFQDDNSLLVYAIVQNRTEIAQELLKLKGPIDLADKNGCTPLMYAIDRNRAAIARSLLKAGADVNRLNRYGQTPLIQAVNVGKPDMIALLLEAGADPNIASPEGETAMSIAQRRNRDVVVSILASAGASLF